MSAHPALGAIGARLRALGCHELGTRTAALGTDLASERTTLSVLDDLVVLLERHREGLVLAEAEIARLRARAGRRE